MKSLKWLSVADRFTKSYMDERLAHLGINSSQHMYLLKICENPGILQDSLLESFYVHPSNVVRTVLALEKKGFLTRTPRGRCATAAAYLHLGYPVPGRLKDLDNGQLSLDET